MNWWQVILRAVGVGKTVAINTASDQGGILSAPSQPPTEIVPVEIVPTEIVPVEIVPVESAGVSASTGPVKQVPFVRGRR